MIPGLLLILGLLAPPTIDLSSVPGLVDARTRVPTLRVELKYATADNFIGRNVYGDFEGCWLVEDAAAKLKAAAEHLAKVRPDLRLLAYDCLRPRRVQRIMWDVVKDTKQRSYVANPNSKTGSIHNYGCAIDLTLARGSDGPALDMGTPFDHFGKAAEPRREHAMLREGTLSAEAFANRLLLREVMVRAGFLPLDNEWWHFSCASNKETRSRYRIVE